MPEEIAIMIFLSIAVASGALMLSYIARMYFRYLGKKAGFNKEDSASLTSSELEEMLRRIVTEGNDPILERIEKIENQLSPRNGVSQNGPKDSTQETKSLPEYKNKPILEDLEVQDDLSVVSKRKTRTV